MHNHPCRDLDITVGDLVKYTGEHHMILADGRWEWIISKSTKVGIVVDRVENGIIILSDQQRFIIRDTWVKEGSAQISVLSETSENR